MNQNAKNIKYIYEQMEEAEAVLAKAYARLAPRLRDGTRMSSGRCARTTNKQLNRWGFEDRFLAREIAQQYILYRKFRLVELPMLLKELSS